MLLICTRTPVSHSAHKVLQVFILFQKHAKPACPTGDGKIMCMSKASNVSLKLLLSTHLGTAGLDPKRARISAMQHNFLSSHCSPIPAPPPCCLPGTAFQAAGEGRKSHSPGENPSRSSDPSQFVRQPLFQQTLLLCSFQLSFNVIKILFFHLMKWTSKVAIGEKSVYFFFYLP